MGRLDEKHAAVLDHADALERNCPIQTETLPETGVTGLPR